MEIGDELILSDILGPNNENKMVLGKLGVPKRNAAQIRPEYAVIME